MFRTLRISVLLLAIFTIASSFVNREKKITKLINKVWKDSELTMEAVELPDTLNSELGVLNRVFRNGEAVGYVCYTTAFGCKVGGCAAPSNPNVQSYETFDYIVVYDNDFSILRVDIAEYGGQYGYEICRAKWLKQFEGSTNGFKLGENVDGITGATVSAQFLIDDLNGVGTDLKTYFATQADL